VPQTDDGHDDGPDGPRLVPDGWNPLQRLPLAGRPEALPLDHAAPLTGRAGPLTQVQTLGVVDTPSGTLTDQASSRRPTGSLRVGAPVRTWTAADPSAPGAAPNTSLTDLPAPRSLVTLNRLADGVPETHPTQDQDVASDPVNLPNLPSLPGVPGRVPRLGIGLPAHSTPDQAPMMAPSGQLPLQRTAYQGGSATERTSEPAPPAEAPDQGPMTPGFTEVLLQRAQAPGSVEPTETAEASAGAGSAAGAGSPAAPADALAGLPSGRALDELVERIYEPLTARLKTELWLDRERSGLMVNLRR